MLFSQENSIATLSCINSSTPSLCDFHMGFYLQVLSPQNFYSPKQTRQNYYPNKMDFHGKPFIYQSKGLETEQTLPL